MHHTGLCVPGSCLVLTVRRAERFVALYACAILELSVAFVHDCLRPDQSFTGSGVAR